MQVQLRLASKGPEERAAEIAPAYSKVAKAVKARRFVEP